MSAYIVDKEHVLYARNMATLKDHGVFRCKCGTEHNRGKIRGVNGYACLPCRRVFLITEVLVIDAL